MTKPWRRLAWFILGCAGTALVVGIVYWLLLGSQSAQSGAETTDAIRQTQVTNHQLLQRVVALSHEIDDCTRPTGKCYHRSQARTAEAVGSINRVVILASACAVGKTGTEAEVQTAIQKCVIRGLATDQH